MPIHKVDANQAEIIRGLRATGCTVVSLAGVGRGVPDLLIGGVFTCPTCGASTHSNLLLEIKNLDGRGARLTPAEIAFHNAWAGQVGIACNLAQALEFIHGRT